MPFIFLKGIFICKNILGLCAEVINQQQFGLLRCSVLLYMHMRLSAHAYTKAHRSVHRSSSAVNLSSAFIVH
jgi:hypothetical protein